MTDRPLHVRLREGADTYVPPQIERAVNLTDVPLLEGDRLIVDRRPRAVVTQVGRWTYSICILHDISRIGPYPGGSWRRLGRRRAERCAERQLRRYLLAQERASIQTVIYCPRERP